MLINKIKKCKPIDIDNKLKEYLIKNNDKNSLSDNLKTFFSELSEDRDKMSKMNELQKSSEEIKENIDKIISYINRVNVLRKKILFGKEKYCLKIQFDWSDTIKGNHLKSYSIDFEIYNSLYNLSILYYCKGLVLAANEMPTKEIRKESTNSFKNAIFVFNVIKEEVNKKIAPKELPSDLNESHLDYCMALCEIEGQIQIYKIAKETNPKDFGLHAKLLLGISNIYLKTYDIIKKIKNKKGEVDNMVLYFENRAKYYKAAMYKDLKNENKKKFDEKGTGYGEVTFFLNKYVQELLECKKTIHKLGKFLNIESFEKELEEAQNSLKETEDLNNRIYHEALPREENITYESKNMMKELIPKKLYIRENEYKLNEDENYTFPELDLLSPKEVREMIGKYRTKINLYVTKNLDQYENEGTIDNYIETLKLPNKLTKKPIKEGEEENENENDSLKKEIPDEIWEKINKVQQIGGPSALNNIMQGIMNKSNYLLNNLENLLHSFEAEDKDDANCRQQYRERWTRPPSQNLNYQMVQGAQQYIMSLMKAKEYDQKENDDIVNNSKYFEELMLTKEKLNENIPHEEEVPTEETEEEKEIRKEILKLYELKDKCTNIIRPLFIQLNDESKVITQFIDVLAKKTTEQIILERNKDSFQLKFNELKKSSDEIKKQEEVINEVVKKNYDKIMPKVNNKGNDDKVDDYYANLYQLSNMFLEKYNKIMKGDKYYNDLKDKIDKLIKYGNDWMINRSNEKNSMINNMNNWQNNQMNNNMQGFGGNPNGF